MEFKDRVKKYMGKEAKPGSEEERKRRQHLISIIEAKTGSLKTVNFDKIDTADLIRIANALTNKP